MEIGVVNVCETYSLGNGFFAVSLQGFSISQPIHGMPACITDQEEEACTIIHVLGVLAEVCAVSVGYTRLHIRLALHGERSDDR